MPHDWTNIEEITRWDRGATRGNPTRGEHLDILLHLLADMHQPGQWLLDLGFGSGIVEALIFERITGLNAVGVDASQAMMDLAAERLARYQDRYAAVKHNLADLDSLDLPEHPYQFCISVQALHHLQPEQMQAAYRYIHRVLEPDGLFFLLDRIQVDTPGLWPVYKSLWTRQDTVYGSEAASREGVTFDDHGRIVAERGDLPVPLEAHLQWLRSAGFEAAVLHLHANRALIGARKI